MQLEAHANVRFRADAHFPIGQSDRRHCSFVFAVRSEEKMVTNLMMKAKASYVVENRKACDSVAYQKRSLSPTPAHFLIDNEDHLRCLPALPSVIITCALPPCSFVACGVKNLLRFHGQCTAFPLALLEKLNAPHRLAEAVGRQKRKTETIQRNPKRVNLKVRIKVCVFIHLLSLHMLGPQAQLVEEFRIPD